MSPLLTNTNFNRLVHEVFEMPEPLLNSDGSIQIKWVCKPLSQREYKKLKVSGKYRAIKKDGNRVVVAFRVPTHLINSQTVTVLSASEITGFGLDN